MHAFLPTLIIVKLSEFEERPRKKYKCNYNNEQKVKM